MNPNAEPFVPRNRITSNGPTNQAGYFLSVRSVIFKILIDFYGKNVF